MAWRRSGDKKFSELMTVSSLTHICVTRAQRVNTVNHNKRSCAIQSSQRAIHHIINRACALCQTVTHNFSKQNWNCNNSIVINSMAPNLSCLNILVYSSWRCHCSIQPCHSYILKSDTLLSFIFHILIIFVRTLKINFHDPSGFEIVDIYATWIQLHIWMLGRKGYHHTLC